MGVWGPALLAIVCVHTTACVQSKLKTCGDTRCPANTVCLEATSECVNADLVSVCADADYDSPEAPTCNAIGGNGVCSDGLCLLKTCGDGEVTDPEQCDDDKLRGQTCESLGYYQGEISCSAFCTFSGCSEFCGDGKVSGPEECDGFLPTGTTCARAGYDRGLATCRGCAASLAQCGFLGWQLLEGATTSNAVDACATSDGKIYLLTEDYNIFRYENGLWESLPGRVINMEAISCSEGPDNFVYRVGNYNDFWRFDPVADSWDKIPSEISRGAFATVHSDSDGNVWIGGGNGLVAKYDGSSVQVQPLIGGDDILAISGDSNILFAVGREGAVFRYTPKGGTRLDSGTTLKLEAVYSNGDEAWMSGSGRAVLHWDGASIEDISPNEHGGSNEVFWDIERLPSGDIVLASGTERDWVLHSGWVYSRDLTAGSKKDKVLVQSEGELFSFGNGGRARKYSGSNIFESSPKAVFDDHDESDDKGNPDAISEEDDREVEFTVTASTTTLSGDIVIARAATGSILGDQLLRRVGSNWTIVDANLPEKISSFWETKLGTRFAVGIQDNPKFWYSPATTDNWIDIGLQNVKAVSGNEDRAYVIFDGGKVFTFIDGGGSNSGVADVSDKVLNAVWASRSDDTVLVVGDLGTIFRRTVQGENIGWVQEESPTSENLLAVWGDGEGNIFAGGENGTLLRRSDGKWLQEGEGLTNSNIVSISGTGASDVFAIAKNFLVRYDGEGWAQVKLEIDDPLSARKSIEAHPDGLFIFQESSSKRIVRSKPW